MFINRSLLNHILCVVLFKDTVMVNSMCWLDWAMGALLFGQTLFQVFLDESSV